MSHLTWVHENTVGGSRKYAAIDQELEPTARGLNTRYWVRSVEPSGAARHLFPAVKPWDADSVDYYYSWGASTETDVPGLSDMLREAIDVAFREDATMLEGQHERMREKPDFPMINLPFDEGPAKMVWVLDKLLREEAAQSERAPEHAA